MTDKQPEVRSDIDKIYSAVMADTEALEDAKMTLEIIKKTDPGVYDEMINDTLSLIRSALSSSILGLIDKLEKENLSQREWQSLTDEEYESMAEKHVTNYFFDTLKYARAIETKLKVKNGNF